MTQTTQICLGRLESHCNKKFKKSNGLVMGSAEPSINSNICDQQCFLKKCVFPKLSSLSVYFKFIITPLLEMAR